MDTTTTAALDRIRTSGARAASHERVTEIIAAIVYPGATIRQGDVSLIAVEAGAADGLRAIRERQLAPGDTQGSRHVAEGDVTVFARRSTNPLVGPLLRVGPGGCTVTHPEHRHYRLPAGTTWGVTYSRDLAQKEIARVQD